MGLLRYAALVLLALAGAVHAADPATLRIGYQKGSISLVLAKQHRLLEQRFANTRVQWIEFGGATDARSAEHRQPRYRFHR